jgi:hypothetical protein
MPEPSAWIWAKRSSSCSLSGTKVSPQRQFTHHDVLREIVLQDPWEIYEPCAGNFSAWPMISVRRRNCRIEFVHGQVCGVELFTDRDNGSNGQSK